MHIEDIRIFFKEHPQYFDASNHVEYKDIKTNRQYLFICDKGHKFYANPHHIVKNNKMGCPVCYGRKVLIGVNDIATVRPDLVQYLASEDDAYKYTVGSNVKIMWRCPLCHHEWKTSPSKMSSRVNKCVECSDHVSYGEKFLMCLLDQMKVCYKHNYMFDGYKKTFDFYIPSRSCIIEVDGYQHYGKQIHRSGRNYFEELANDLEKMEFAQQHGVKYFFRIDAKLSTYEHLMQSIIDSDLLPFLKINIDDCQDQLKKCHAFACKNLTYTICKDYNGDIYSLSEKYHLSYNTIKQYLKNGAILGWCNYDAQKAIQKARAENGKRVLDTMCKPVLQLNQYGTVIGEYPSIQAAQRNLNISHVWDCLVGKRKTAGGYQWQYAERR